jgi:hypothetical protein
MRSLLLAPRVPASVADWYCALSNDVRGTARNGHPAQRYFGAQSHGWNCPQNGLRLRWVSTKFHFWEQNQAQLAWRLRQ